MKTSNTSAGSGPQISSSFVGAMDVGSTFNPVYANKTPSIAFGTERAPDKSATSSNSCSILQPPTFSTAVCFSSSDSVLVPSDSQAPGAVSATNRELGSHHPPGNPAFLLRSNQLRIRNLTI